MIFANDVLEGNPLFRKRKLHANFRGHFNTMRIALLLSSFMLVAAAVGQNQVFWKAEDYHQDYYDHKGTHPYCHFHRKLF